MCVFVCVFFYDPEPICSLLKLNKSDGTRGHPFKLCKKTVLTNQYEHFFFTHRVINSWNNLPSDIVLTRTLSSFKNPSR